MERISFLHKTMVILFGVHIAFAFILFSGCATKKSLVKPESEEKVFEEKKVAISEFILGPGDKIEIAVWRYDDLKREVQIDPSGKIIYPLVGDIEAGGMSIFQIRDKIRDGLSKYIVDPQVSIRIISVQNQKVLVLGEVKNPGIFQIEGSMDALEAVARSGGFTLDAKKKSVILIRGGIGKPELKRLDFDNALKEGDLTQNIALQRGDIVYVPRTFISNVDRFFEHFSKIISPLVTLEGGIVLYPLVEDVLSGEGRVPTVAVPSR